MTEQENVKQIILLDTSPLITLCGFAINGKTIIDYILPHCELVVVDSVAREATANLTYQDAVLISQLLQARQIRKLPCPTPPETAVIDGYSKLGQGERDTIKLTTMMSFAHVIFDDYLAFVVASRFGLKPMLLLDFIVKLTQENHMDKSLGLAITNQISPRYSIAFVEHTRHKLGGV